MKCNRVLCCFFLMVSALINNVAVADVRVDVEGDDFDVSPELREYGDFFIRSLNPGSSNDQDNFDFFGRNKCKDRSVKCYLLLNSLGNLLIDQGDLENGLKSAIYGYELIHESSYCPVAYEIVVVNYKIEKIKAYSFFQTSKRARLLLDKIKNFGGVSNDLRTESCEALKVNFPFYFDKYSELVDVLYELAE